MRRVGEDGEGVVREKKNHTELKNILEDLFSCLRNLGGNTRLRKEKQE